MKELLKAKSEFRQRGVTLRADRQKEGAGGQWKFASEDNFLKTIQQPLSECGLEYIAVMDYLPELGQQTVKGMLLHIDSGESISSVIALPEIEPRKDRNGNAMYLDAEIERGKQFGYWSRILGIRLLGLSDIDPEDVNNIPQQLRKTYNTWSKANENEKKVYKVEFRDICVENGVGVEDIPDFFNFLNPALNDNEHEKHNAIVQFLRSQDEYFIEQLEAYKGWKLKNG